MARKAYSNATAAETNAPARDIEKGTYVRRTNRDGTPQKKVYVMGAYCRFNMGYELTDDNDINRAIYVNAGSLLNVGFTY